MSVRKTKRENNGVCRREGACEREGEYVSDTQGEKERVWKGEA